MKRLAVILSILAAVCVFGTILFYAWKPVANYDIFWHMATGRLIAEQGQIPQKNTFNYPNPDDKYENECWLFDLASYLFWRAGDVRGICWYRAAVVLLMFLVAFIATLKRRLPLTVALAFILLSLFLIKFRFMARNFLLSYLFFVTYLYLLPTGDRRSQKLALIMYPLIMVIWANVHIGCSFGVGLVGLGFVASLLKRSDEFPRPKYWLALLVVVFLASGVSPYPFLWIKRTFYNLVVYVPQRTLEEKPASPSEFGLLYLALATCVAAGIYRFRRLHPFWLLSLAAFGAAAALFLRFIGFFGLFLPIYLAELYRAAASDRSPANRLEPRAAAVAALIVVMTCGAKVASDYDPEEVGCRVDCGLLPCGATEFMKNNLMPAPIYNSWGFGGYLEWELFPVWKTFWDSRSYAQLNKANRVRAEGLLPILKDYGVKYAVLSMRSAGDAPVLAWFEKVFLSDDWVPIYFDRAAALLVNRNLAPDVARELGFSAIRPLTRELPSDAEGLRLAFLELERAKNLVGRPDMFLTQTEARLLIRTRRFDEAEKVLADGLKRWPKAGSLYALAGELYLKTGEPERALANLVEARKHEGDSPSILNNLGIAYLQLGEPSKAVRAFKRALKSNPRFALAAYNLSLAYKAAGEDEKAARWLDYYRKLISRTGPEEGR